MQRKNENDEHTKYKEIQLKNKENNDLSDFFQMFLIKEKMGNVML